MTSSNFCGRHIFVAIEVEPNSATFSKLERIKNCENQVFVTLGETIVVRSKMEGKGMGFLSLAILLASLFQNSCSTKPVICPKIHVSKNQIIQTRESLTAGARYLSYNKLEDARQCYKLCCETELCDLAQLQYKNVSGGGVERTCYLFHCGHPSKCSFKPHEHYATIEFAQRQEPQVAKGEAKSKNSQRSKYSRLQNNILFGRFDGLNGLIFTSY